MVYNLTIPKRNGANHLIFGLPIYKYSIYPRRPQKLSTLNPFVAIALTSEKPHHIISLLWYFEASAWLFFWGDIFLIFLDLTFSRQIPFVVFERVPTKTKNRVSFWGLRFREKSSLVFCPTFSRTCLVSETSHRDRWQRVSISRFRLDCLKRNREAMKSRRFLSSTLRCVAQKRWVIQKNCQIWLRDVDRGTMSRRGFVIEMKLL